MVNLSPHQLDEVRVFTVEEHDKGLNLRSCPFTRTCWVMFLAFPLDFQTRSIISQAFGLFGDVITWTDNSRCKSRILLRCKVSLVSRIPRSLIISEGSTVGASGNSWTVPVFVLDSHLNDIEPADEDQSPPMATLTLLTYISMLILGITFRVSSRMLVTLIKCSKRMLIMAGRCLLPPLRGTMWIGSRGRNRMAS
jgi:hypothetical protein